MNKEISVAATPPSQGITVAAMPSSLSVTVAATPSSLSITIAAMPSSPGVSVFPIILPGHPMRRGVAATTEANHE